MIKPQNIALVRPARPSGRAFVAIAAAAVMLMAVIALLAQSYPLAGREQESTGLLGAPTVLTKAGDPTCAAAWAKARDTRHLAAPEAIAVSTEMLRACEARQSG